MKNLLFYTLFLFSFHKAYSQISESFESSFPPTGWSFSHDTGTTDWVQATTFPHSGNYHANSSSPASGANKKLVCNINVSSSASEIAYYIAVSSIGGSTVSTILVYAGPSIENLTLLRTISIEGLSAANTYYQFKDYIDGSNNQSGNMIDLRNNNDAYILWVHNKTSGSTAPSCRLDDISISNVIALPVELTSFTSLVNKSKVILIWSTATEVNNYGFKIERKELYSNWEEIGFVPGSGNSNSPKNYRFTDQPLGGIDFKYRLRQIDFDGTYEYSNEIEVFLNEINKFTLEQNYPNPFNPTTTIRFSLPIESFVTIKVFNLLGEQVSEVIKQSFIKGFHELKFDGSHLASGVYFYQFSTGDFNATKKFIVAR